MKYLRDFIIDFIGIFNEMSPYLLLGFLFAGILKVFLPQKFIDKNLQKANFRSVFYAALLGVPMPLCSCGVIPTGISIYKSGAGKGATVSFLISTPQTGIDSILVTYSLLGLPFAIIRPIVAFTSGILGGLFTNRIDTHTTNADKTTKCNNNNCSTDTNIDKTKKTKSKLYTMFKYAFVDFLQDIAKWLIIGLLLAAFISVLVPDNFFEQFIGNQWLEMFIILLVAIPLYVCATGSIPIAAVLMLKGLSPGAALVFLMAGPATNAATITVLRKSLGKKTLWTYLISIILGAFIFGILINNFLPSQWFSTEALTHLHSHKLVPEWLKWASTISLILLIVNALYQKKKNININTQNSNKMNEKTIIVNGMNCNHCKNSVEKHISALPNIDSARVNLETKQLVIQGEDIDIKQIAKEIESLGFEYGGEKS